MKYKKCKYSLIKRFIEKLSINLPTGRVHFCEVNKVYTMYQGWPTRGRWYSVFNGYWYEFRTTYRKTLKTLFSLKIIILLITVIVELGAILPPITRTKCAMRRMKYYTKAEFGYFKFKFLELRTLLLKTEVNNLNGKQTLFLYGKRICNVSIKEFKVCT